MGLSQPQPRKGVLLVNLGTPDAPRTPEVRRYLREFLMDPYVIDLPWIFRWLLVHGAILPRRPAASAEAYRKIWSERGSPLKFLTEELKAKVQSELGPGFAVEYAMRYGSPSLEAGLERLERAGVTEVVALPLYPQYSLAATESSMARLRELNRIRFPLLRLKLVGAFFRNADFLWNFAEIARKTLEGYPHDFVLFSFHGLPEKQVRKIDRSGRHCLNLESCCDSITEENRDCYRAQCFATAHGIATRLGLPREKYGISFQSRLSEKWIRPFTDDLYSELPKRGVKRLAVMSPAFVADCLETLEEIQIRGREQFIQAGGEELRLVPSLNAEDCWARTVSKMVRDAHE